MLFQGIIELGAYLEQLCKLDGQVGRHLVVTGLRERRLSPRSVPNDSKKAGGRVISR